MRWVASDFGPEKCDNYWPPSFGGRLVIRAMGFSIRINYCPTLGGAMLE